jgi:hypothetical protein
MAKTMQVAFDFLFGCWHRNLSRPFTLSGWTYEVCLNCGKKLAYDRADIGCVAAPRTGRGGRDLLHKNSRRGEFLPEGCTTISLMQVREQVRTA